MGDVNIGELSGRDLAMRVVSALKQHGHQAYWVGGCVRDILLGIDPKDYDVATDATPERLQSLFPGADLVGAHFGVILVRGGGAMVQVATFRSDLAYRDGRRPQEVRFEQDPRQDVLRRDFTINAMLMDPDTGKVLDFAGGQEDLRRRLIRTVGDPQARFAEDHLRMLRAVRFAARLGFTLDPAAVECIRRLRRCIQLVSAERIRDELTRILIEGGARCGMELLDECGLLEELLPEVAAMKGVAQPPQFHPEGDVWTHTLLMLDAMQKPTITLALGVLLHDVGKPPTFRVADRIRFDNHDKVGAKMARSILTRLRYSGQETDRVAELVAHHLRFREVTRMRDSTLKRFLRMEHFAEHLELHRLDCLCSHRDLTNYEFVAARLRELAPEQLRPQRLIGGDDLIREGFQPGPAFRRILEELESAQLDSRIKTREEALALLRRRYQPPHGSLRQAGK